MWCIQTQQNFVRDEKTHDNENGNFARAEQQLQLSVIVVWK